MITKGSSLILSLIALLIALTLISPVVTGDMSPGMFMGIIAAVFGMINQLGWQLSWALENISSVGEYIEDINMFKELSITDDSLAEPDWEPVLIDTLEFRNVKFKYPGGDRFVLDGLSFILKSGVHYAFVGKNGTGKTTITKLLTGLYNEYEGEIFINNKELRQYPAGTLKALFSVVYQDFARYYISLEDNITLGDVAGRVNGDVPGYDTDIRLTDVIKQAGLNKIVNELKDGIKTPLGKILENGQDVSGGQWQRVAIARSLISRSPIKILDEPTAALDPISESQIYEEFEKLMEGKTTIFISHRLGSTKLADDILVIDDGKIIERGTHDSLIDMNGQYAMMYETQKEWYQ
jgi:ATP-binding cassette subfamily B protein